MLLSRIASEWLAPGGSVLLDIFNPLRWARVAGESRIVQTDRGGEFRKSNDFDPVTCRFLDSWQPVGGGELLTKSIRCYTPSDFLMLIAGTGPQAIHFSN